MKNNKEKRTGLFPSALMAGTAVFMLALYAPLAFYFGNVEEFDYDAIALFKMMLPVFLLCTAAAVTVIFFLFLFRGKRLLLALQLIGWGAVFILFFQGTFLTKNLPPMDGREIIWQEYSAGRIGSVLLIAAVTGGLIFSVRKFGAQRVSKVLAKIGAFLLMFLVLSLGLSAFTGDGMTRKTDCVTTYNGALEMSDEQNFVIFVLDAVDGKVYQDALKKNPQFQTYFEDFTCYPDTLGTYPFTTRSVPFILTGQWYENEQSFRKYTEAALADSPLLSALEEKQYSLGIYETELKISEAAAVRFENTANASGSKFMYPLAFYKIQFKLVGYRYFPFDLKRFCETSSAGIFNATERELIDGDDVERFGMANEKFTSRLEETGVTVFAGNRFRFIHLHGAHHPLVYPTYEEQVVATMAIAHEYLEELKQHDVYDNSVIVIMADHGYTEDDEPTARCNPLLMIKGRNEKHAYVNSTVPVSFADLQDAFLALLDGETGEGIFPYAAGQTRQRRYLCYDLYGTTLTEYLHTGPAWDSSGLEKTGTVYEVK